MRSFTPLSVETVAEELANLPSIQPQDPNALSDVQIALARAIASRQDPKQLAQDLSAPTIWLEADLKKAKDTHKHKDAHKHKRKSTAPPAWALSAAKVAVQAASALRVAVLPRDPSTIPSLEFPTWTIGQRATTTYGPLQIENVEAQLTVEKWIQIFLIPSDMVAFVRGSTTIFVAPISSTNNVSGPGSVWINASLFASDLPANSFVGITVGSAFLTSDETLEFGGTTVTIPADANLELRLYSLTAATGLSNPASEVAPPISIQFNYPSIGPATAFAGGFTASVYGETFNWRTSDPTLVFYNDTVKSLVFPADIDQTTFEPIEQAGTLLTLNGSAQITAAGWALQVTQSSPATLGNAENAGFFFLELTNPPPTPTQPDVPRLFIQWTGLSQPEVAAGGLLLASTGSLRFWSSNSLPFSTRTLSSSYNFGTCQAC